MLKESIDENLYSFLPINIGIENNSINNAVSEYNLLLKERSSLLLSAGPNNLLVRNIEDQLDSYYKNVLKSINNYIDNLDVKITSIQDKESEFTSISCKFLRMKRS